MTPPPGDPAIAGQPSDSQASGVEASREALAAMASRETPHPAIAAEAPAVEAPAAAIAAEAPAVEPPVSETTRLRLELAGLPRSPLAAQIAALSAVHASRVSLSTAQRQRLLTHSHEHDYPLVTARLTTPAVGDYVLAHLPSGLPEGMFIPQMTTGAYVVHIQAGQDAWEELAALASGGDAPANATSAGASSAPSQGGSSAASGGESSAPSQGGSSASSQGATSAGSGGGQALGEEERVVAYLAGLMMATGTMSGLDKPVHVQVVAPCGHLGQWVRDVLDIWEDAEDSNHQDASHQDASHQDGVPAINSQDAASASNRQDGAQQPIRGGAPSHPATLYPPLPTACLAMGHPCERAGEGRVVLKSIKRVTNVLQRLGATASNQRFIAGRKARNLVKQATRAVNADNANVRKTTQAAGAQIEAIESLVEAWGWDGIPEELQEIALVRVVNPEATLAELGALVTPTLSKSAVYRRLTTLITLAQASIDGD